MFLGEKIKQIRKAKGLSQENLAQAAKCGIGTINRIENGQAECNPEMLTILKKFMDVEGAPLFDHELEVYKFRLFTCRDWLVANRIEDVKAMLGNLRCIMDLPFEHDLILMFLTIEIRLFMKDSSISAIEENLNKTEAYLDKAGDEALYLYHSVKGLYYHNIRYDVKNAIKHYLQALAHEKDDSDLILRVNLGVSYFILGKPIQAIDLLKHIQTSTGDSISDPVKYHVDMILASCYALIGEYNKAKNLYDKIVLYAKIVNNKHNIGELLSNMSLMHIKMGNYQECINLCDEALTCLQERRREYNITLYQKGLALLKMNKLNECKEIIAYGLSLSEGDEMSTVNFNTLKHLITLNNAASVSYIENTAIPFFRDNGIHKFQALDLCKVLKQHYNKKKSKIKALSLAETMQNIYEEIFLGEVEQG